jgi:hypothetical protein
VADITDVGVDLDGVVYPFVEAFRSYCAHRLGTPDLPSPVDWHFYRSWGIPDDQFVKYMEEAATDYDVFSMLPPEAGTADGWATLKALGVRIHVITHRPPAAWAQTANWLERWELVPDTLVFAKDKTVVSHFAQPGKAAMVEDYTVAHDALVSAGVHAVLIDRPWNEGHPGIRVRSFADFATHIHDLKENA